MARRVAKTFDEGNDVVVVISAMAGVTNRLIELAEEVTGDKDPTEREMDVLRLALGLGYGDITPVSDTARSLASLEAVFGQVFLAVLVAWLVGKYLSHSERRESVRE